MKFNKKDLRLIFGRVITVATLGTAAGTIAHHGISESNGSRDLLKKCINEESICTKEEWRKTSIQRFEDRKLKAIMAASGTVILLTPLFPQARREEKLSIKPQNNST